MEPPPFSAKEDQRFAAVSSGHILNSPAEAEFDDFRRLASQICGTPFATIKLVNVEKQWLKSRSRREENETSRDDSVIRRTAFLSEIFKAPHGLENETIGSDQVLADDPNIHYCIPLVTPDGLNIGALCVVDRTPHEFTPEQREMLALLSRQVVHLLELRLAGRHIQWLNKNLEHLVHKRTEELRESEERFRQLAEQSGDVFWFVGLNPMRILYVSPGVEKIWGLPAERFYHDSGLYVASLHSDDQDRVRNAFEDVLSGRTPRFETEYRVVRPDGTLRWVSDNGTPIRNADGKIVRIGGIAKDITERKQAESQRLRAQRLESIGTLTGGIAHDLNNSLAPILMATGLLRTQYPTETELIDTVESSAKRGADMVRQLLTFAKGVEGERLKIDPQHLLKEMATIIEGTFPKNIQLRSAYSKKLHNILGDATQLHQVLLNLCVNARDAMPNGGTLTLEAENREIDATYASAVPDAKPGRYVVWRVTDTGTGIPPELIDRIFEPFFSTKGPDRGTGLGLSTVMGIIKSHGGFIQIYSVEGQGSIFTIYLPADLSIEPGSSPRTKIRNSFRGHGETILVVDDEANLRRTVRAVLTSLNFKVLTAASGTEALVQVAENRMELGAVITDLHMPDMDGLTFARVLKSMLPNAGIIVASGRMEERDANQFKTLGVAALLDKPFNQEGLVESLRIVFPQL